MVSLGLELGTNVSRDDVSEDRNDRTPVWTNLSDRNNCNSSVYVVWDDGSGVLVDDFFNGAGGNGDHSMRRGKFVLGRGESDNAM